MQKTESGRLQRRLFLQDSVLAGLGAALPRRPLWAAEGPATLAEDTYIWGFPRLIMAEYFDDLSKRAIAPNQFFVFNRIAKPADSEIGPATDLLYGTGWLSLEKEPVVLSVPDTADRYYSIQFIDADADCFAYVGRRATGTRAGHYLIAGPGWRGTPPAKLPVIRSTSNRAVVLTRTFVAGDEDLAASTAVQAQYGLTPLSRYPQFQFSIVQESIYFPPVPRVAALGAAFFDRLGDSLASDGISPPVRAGLARAAKIGVGPGLHPASNTRKVALFSEAVERGDRRIRDFDPNTHINDWSVNLHATEFISDPLTKAVFNRLGPGGHIAKEALYFFPGGPPGAGPRGHGQVWNGLGPDGRPLSGERNYLLRFPAGQQPPVDAFWSLTLYGPDWHVVSNPINRYALRDRTKGLALNPDGSLALWIQHRPPAGGTSNWLPTPRGPFHLILRTYQPRPELLNGAYRLPALQIA